jgi:hypothetical protein
MGIFPVTKAILETPFIPVSGMIHAKVRSDDQGEAMTKQARNRSTVSESAVRARFDRRRRARPADQVEVGRRVPTARTIAVDASSSGGESPLLRRWSVAELIARAAARSAPGEPARC